jgi:hypothetical protein
MDESVDVDSIVKEGGKYFVKEEISIQPLIEYHKSLIEKYKALIVESEATISTLEGKK